MFICSKIEDRIAAVDNRQTTFDQRRTITFMMRQPNTARVLRDIYGFDISEIDTSAETVDGLVESIAEHYGPLIYKASRFCEQGVLSGPDFDWLQKFEDAVSCDAENFVVSYFTGQLFPKHPVEFARELRLLITNSLGYWLQVPTPERRARKRCGLVVGECLLLS